jgi:formate dehydrogenase major subunit
MHLFLRLRVWLTDQVRPGVVYVTPHFQETTVNLLTIPALDPAAEKPQYEVAAVTIRR